MNLSTTNYHKSKDGDIICGGGEAPVSLTEIADLNVRNFSVVPFVCLNFVLFIRADKRRLKVKKIPWRFFNR